MTIFKKNGFGFLLILTLVFYIAGIFFMKPTDIEGLKEKGVAQQEEYTYEDSDGDEHEGLTLISIAGVGKILTYKDIYISSVSIWLLAMIIGCFLEKGVETEGEKLFKYIIISNCVLGVLLIRLTTKEFILSTIFFWLGIITAFIDSIIVSDKGA
ncbi:MAG: hypothetical protein J5711_05830 [Bacteroidales bacterium]|nr:hypothetical protein [Bacteroidales bacterium]